MMLTTWRSALTGAMEENGESLADIKSSTMTDQDMDTAFDDGLGYSEGCAFTVWTDKSVYFPCVYDGSEWVGRVARNPDGVATAHIGGQ